MDNSFYKLMTEAIRAAVDEVFDGSKINAAKACGATYSTMCRWYTGDTSPRIEDIAALMDLAGYTIVKRDEPASTDYRFECPDNLERQDIAEFENTNFVAIPIVKDVDRLTDFVPKENRLSWALVDREAPSIQGRKNLVCVVIQDTLMSPTLNPDDWCLVDRDKKIEESGRMYLVRDPSGSRTAIRRVTFKRDGDDVRIVCVNDNHTVARAEIFSLKKDYAGDITKAILGQVVWIRANARNK